MYCSDEEIFLTDNTIARFSIYTLHLDGTNQGREGLTADYINKNRELVANLAGDPMAETSQSLEMNFKKFMRILQKIDDLGKLPVLPLELDTTDPANSNSFESLVLESLQSSLSSTQADSDGDDEEGSLNEAAAVRIQPRLLSSTPIQSQLQEGSSRRSPEAPWSQTGTVRMTTIGGFDVENLLEMATSRL